VAIILHVIARGDWEAVRLAPLYRPPSLAAEGFIHCSEGEAQALAVAERLFAGQTDLLLLEIDTGGLGSEVRYEPGALGGLYPHIYGPLENAAVRRPLPCPQ
jgi:uncharacterized protein (DUF952 family)